jgi:UDP-glucose 4-epimerase
MKILITGGAGFIGSHLVEKLLELQNEVLVIDNYQTGRRDNLIPQKNLTIIEDTIANYETLEQLFNNFNPELVIHAAASYKDPENWIEDVQTNILGTINIVKLSKKFNVQKIIYFQTALCYGLHPIEQPITLKHPLFSGKSAGGSSYAITKTAGEQFIELSGINFISFRLANAYGPRNLSGPLPTFYHRLTTGKACFVMDTRRDFIFIDDLIDCVIKGINSKGQGYYHISSGTDYSIKELFDCTLNALNIKLDSEIEVRKRGEDDVFTILIDPSKTNVDFGWSVKTTLNDGIKKAIEWYKINGISQTYTHLKSE